MIRLKKQKFLCKDCNKYQIREFDSRKKYDESVFHLPITIRLHTNFYLSILKISFKIILKQKISYQLLSYYCNVEYDKLKDIVLRKKQPKPQNKINIIELDKLYTFIK